MDVILLSFFINKSSPNLQSMLQNVNQVLQM